MILSDWLSITVGSTMNAEVEDNIRKNVPWAKLGDRIKQVGGNLRRPRDH